MNPIPFINLAAQYQAHEAEIQQAITTVLKSGLYILGPEVHSLETHLSIFTGAPFAIACSSGSDAELLALMAIDIGPGDEVITTPFSFISTASMISLLGATPVFVDICADTFHIDVQKIAEKITSKTKAIMPVSIFGQVADMDEINQIAKTYSEKMGHKIYVIEDAAQSFGAEYKNKKSCNLSDLAFTSFFPTKPLGCYGDGGAVFAQDKQLADKLFSLRVHGQEQRYHHTRIGINARMDTLQAAVLNVKLKYFPDELKVRHLLGQRYTEFLSPYPNIICPLNRTERTHIYAQYSVLSSKREQLMKILTAHNIQTSVHYPQPLHLQTCFAHLNYKVGDFKVAENISQQIFSLPMNAHLSFDDLEYVAATLQKHL